MVLSENVEEEALATVQPMLLSSLDSEDALSSSSTDLLNSLRCLVTSD